MNKYLFNALILVCLLPTCLFSQGENNLWYLNAATFLDFNTSPPSLIEKDNFIATIGLTSTVCDKDGNLLFYTNGTRVIDSTHQLMPNGVIELNTNFSTMPCLIVPMWGNNRKYYLFTLIGNAPVLDFQPYIPGELYYSIIDMDLNNGKGDVEVNNRRVFIQGNLAAKLIAIKGECGSIWVITHEINNNRFLAFEVNERGISEPIISEVGSVISDEVTIGEEGFICISPNQKKIANGGGIRNFIEIFDFNSKTGKLSNPLSLPLEKETINVISGCFSSNNENFYLVEGYENFSDFGGGGNYRSVFSQYHFNNDSSSINNKTILNNIEGNGHRAMQRGKDGVIYIRKNENLITGILFPNKIGEKCEYRDSLYWHESRAVNFSELHNLVVIPDMPSQTDSLLLPQDTQLCQNTTLQLEVKAQGESYLWQDGSTTPNYELSQAGTYWVEVQKGNCTFTDTIVVLPDESAIALGSDTMLCQGDEITLNLSESKDLEWQDGSKTPSFTVRESGIYWVESKDSLCRFRDSIHITYKAAALNLGADRVICPNDSAILLTTALSSNEVRWQDGSINNDFTAREAGLYWAETINRECPEKDSIVIRVEAAIPFLPKDTIICGETVYLVKPEITNDSLFWWASGAIGKEIAIDSTGVYMATIYKNNCSWTDSLRVDFIKNIGINLPADTSLCKGNTLSLDYSDKEGVLNWQDGSTNPNYEIKEAGLYWLEQRKGSCSSRDSMRVFFESLSIDLGADTSICEGNVLEIDLSQANGNYYLWQDGLNSAQRILTEAGLYSVEVGTDVCIAKDSFVLEIETCATEQACQIYIPNAFSPNSDGINDYLELQSNCELFDYKLQVFDRWGNRVYESADPIAFWDGKYHNEHLDNGVYLVYIACRFEGEKRMENRVETVTVFR